MDYNDLTRLAAEHIQIELEHLEQLPPFDAVAGANALMDVHRDAIGAFSTARAAAVARARESFPSVTSLARALSVSRQTAHRLLAEAESVPVRTGSKAPRSGIYKPENGGKEIALAQGDPVPPSNGIATSYKLVRGTR